MINNTYYQFIIDHSLDMISVLSKSGIVEYQNPAITELLGYEQEELIGKNALDYIHPLDKIQITNTLAEGIMKPGERKLLQFRFKNKSGLYRTIEANAQYYKEENFDGIIVISRDISSKKERDNQLRLLTTAIEKSNNIIFMTDPEGLFTYVNPSFTQTYGYEPEEVLHVKTPRILKSGMVPQESYTIFWNNLKKNLHYQGEFINKRKDNSLVTVGVSVNPVSDDENTIIGYIAIQYDLTIRVLQESELKKHQDELQLKNDELQRVNKLMIDREIRMIELKKEIDNLKGTHKTQ